MTSVLRRREALREDQVRTQGEGDLCKPSGEASGETNHANTLVSELGP
jgi:hypothetical protein